ncbi:tumor necrosis factor receptor superfamily member 5 isoform X1 [Gambusia affinis]|uniref:tumor necrosis factor receptor superfamily member 5 isoform X1 n=1 Tax=Gambusia affinis TaxID=33528 RepID=UPI001CDD0D2C|nr:tumor necrosis factor receptor superfamily member 5 isoform X1 [Gambusia affinis]
MFGSQLLLLSVLMGMSAAQSLCDPETQYDLNKQCCMKCGPGTKMTDNNCETPKCEPCGPDEYQETYTIENKCEPQPYCDPNKNMYTGVHDSKKKAVCLCKPGFHCSSEYCEVCRPHKQCGPGQGVKSKGDQTHDTVCQPCMNGTFSNETSMNDRCIEHTKCPPDYTTEVAGTDRSDTVCVKKSRVHVIVGTVMGIFLVACCVFGVFLYCQRKSSLEKGKKLECIDCIGPTAIYGPNEEASLFPGPQTPVENEDRSIPSQEDARSFTAMSFGSAGEHGISENGKIVCSVEEEGKMARLPRQESQVSSSSTVGFSS